MESNIIYLDYDDERNLGNETLIRESDGDGNETIYIKNFKSCKTATKTDQFIFDSNINLIPVTLLFPVLYEQRGTTFMMYKNLYRGDIEIKINKKGKNKGKMKNNFKSGIEGRYNYNNKNIAFKIFNNRIALNGHTSREMGEDVAKNIIDKMVETDVFIKNIKENKKLYKKSYTWILNNCIGEQTTTTRYIGNCESSVSKSGEIIISQILEEDSEDYFLNYNRCEGSRLEKNSFSYQNGEESEFINIPEDKEYFIQELLIRTCDIRYKSELIYRLKAIRSYIDYINIKNNRYVYKRTLTNKNYNLGNFVNRKHANEVFSTNNTDSFRFSSIFPNFLREHVMIFYDYENNNIEDVCRKSNKYRDKFKVRMSGKIAHSGIGENEMEDIYIKFMTIICKHMNKICLDI